MHVGLNLVYWQPDSGGSGTYARELIKGLHRVAPGIRVTGWVGTGAPPGIDVEDWGGPTRFVHLPLKSVGSPVHVGYELALLGFAARRHGVDLVHGPAYATPLAGVPTVVTLLDLTWHHHPDAVSRLARTMLGLETFLCGRTADRIIAISETVKRDLVQTARLPAERIDVTPLGVSHAPLAEPVEPAVEGRFVLCVGQISAHKNLGVLVDALAALPADVRLVLPGRTTAHADALVARARAAGLEDRVVLAGFVSEAELEGLFARAACFALPSLFEGFGLPILEAMRRGVPVACSDASSLPEVAGGAALLFDPRSVESVAGALRRLLEDGRLRDELVAKGRARAAQLTWDATARATLVAYEKALAA